MVNTWYENVRGKYALYPALTSAAFLWFAATLLMVLAYLKKRKATKERLAQMQAEDEFIDHVLNGSYH